MVLFLYMGILFFYDASIFCIAITDPPSFFKFTQSCHDSYWLLVGRVHLKTLWIEYYRKSRCWKLRNIYLVFTYIHSFFY